MSEAHKIPILSCDPCLPGRQKNSKCSGLDPIFSHIVFLMTFFSQSNKVHPESFGPIVNIVWGESP